MTGEKFGSNSREEGGWREVVVVGVEGSNGAGVNPSTGDAEVGGSGVQNQRGLHHEALSQRQVWARVHYFTKGGGFQHPDTS
jgi:hypothetical protein